MNLKEALDSNVQSKKQMMDQAEWWRLKLLPYAHELNEMILYLYIYHGTAEIHPNKKTDIRALRTTLSKAFGTNGTWEKEVEDYSGNFYLSKKIAEGDDCRGVLKLYTKMPSECRLIKEETLETTYRMECSKK